MKKSLSLIILMTLVLFSAAAESENGLSGRHIAEKGKLINISGIFSEKDGEWYLTTVKAGEKVYAVHLGNEDYSESIGFILSEGDSAELEGFSIGSDIAAKRIMKGGKEYLFRDEDGAPLWRGNGRGRNRQQES